MENYARLFDRYLNNLKTICQKVATIYPGDEFFNKRLHPDMLPFINQVKTACNFAIRGCAPAVNEPVITFDQAELSWQSLYQQIDGTRKHVAALAQKEISAQHCSEQAGFNRVELSSRDFIELYIIPNFFFHLSMAYAIARAEGIAISKGDYDGFHTYPPGFSFAK